VNGIVLCVLAFLTIYYIPYTIYDNKPSVARHILKEAITYERRKDEGSGDSQTSD